MQRRSFLKKRAWAWLRCSGRAGHRQGGATEVKCVWRRAGEEPRYTHVPAS